MELTRYWPAESAGNKIEVQWTGFRFRGGWTLRLLINRELRAERKVGRFARNFEPREGPVRINFLGTVMFRHRCTISSGDKVLVDKTQPWNPLAFAFVGTLWSLALVLEVLMI